MKSFDEEVEDIFQRPCYIYSGALVWNRPWKSCIITQDKNVRSQVYL